MSKLYFRYSPMNAGKSTSLLQVAHNYHERGQRAVIAKPTVDTKSEHVLSRMNISAPVDWAVSPDNDVLEDFYLPTVGHIDCVLVDEAQFLTPQQVDQFFQIAVSHDVPVIAYGIRTDFMSHAFPGAARLFEIAHSIEEMKTICRCGSKAIFNARKVSGKFVRTGGMVAIDGEGVEYESLCGACYTRLVGSPRAADS